ncbi:cytochrome P450 302a1, mitochondrial-like isoform X1 [Daphnia pulex]|uniref:cytochrome P450 302a1, mitochondrial-like isoform X1 n=2 Tax=Daphnia pulex TaxID=6669 RepID=UPI001EDF5B5C|nr:cytochrome P450 302a1, mitochondrial-like isoform X1 [Daphnia pulex]
MFSKQIPWTLCLPSRLCGGQKCVDKQVYYFNQTTCIHNCPHQFPTSDSTKEMKPFGSIPGPKPLPVVGNIWRYAIGQYSFDQLHVTGLKKYLQFGPIVREEILPGVNLLLLYRPEDIERMHQVEGRYPSRRSHTALEFYRLQRPHIYNSGGLLPTNGPEWYRLRQALQRPINMMENIRQYIPGIDSISSEFAEQIAISIKKNKTSPDFLEDLSKVFLEFIGLVTFDTRLGSLRTDLPVDSCPNKLIQAASDTNSEILRTDNGLQFWRKWNTPAYKRITRSQEYFERVASEFVNAKNAELRSRNDQDQSQKTLLEVYLTSKDLDVKDVVTMVSDMLLAGIDTSSYTMSFILYHLARNPLKQEKVYQEVNRFVPNSTSPVTQDILAELKYLKAAVKESFRLNPISIGVGRILPEDSSFSGYHCPKNTILVSQNQVSCKLDRYFKNPLLFVPERWMKGDPAYEKTHPYLVLPFGHGPRACIARRLAEQNLYILLARLVKRFSIEWNGAELDVRSQLINRPDAPLKFNFIERRDC